MSCQTLHQPVIGLMGAPGSGKSLVAQQLAQLGCAVIDADEIAKAQLDEPQIAQVLEQWWGDSVRSADGCIDRQAVGRIVFEDKTQLARLEALIHPRVHAHRHRLRAQYRQDQAIKAIVEDCPLLLESGLGEDCDVLVFVDTPRAIRLKRVAAQRGWTPEELDRREKNQMPLDMKRKRADYVVENDADVEQTLQRVRRIFSLTISEFA